MSLISTALYTLETLPSKGVSQESALKMLELTAGKVATMYDSPLGFRHGPKSIIDDRTLTVVYLSDDEYRRKYEVDLIKEMSPQRKKNRIVAVMNTSCEEVKALVDYTVEIKAGAPLENVLLGFDYHCVCPDPGRAEIPVPGHYPGQSLSHR